MLGLKRGIVELYDHDKMWEINAKETINKLKAIFGITATDIQHVGSTSIVHIKSKPIIDIAVAVNCFDDVLAIVQKLEEAGFIHRSQNDEPWEIYFSCGDEQENLRTHHINVVKANSKEWRDYINFRDYLNANLDIAKEYENLKLQLMNTYKHDRDSYTNGKAKFIIKTLRKAQDYFTLGKIVTVIVDRPMRSIHPQYDNIIYPINYGYVEGIIASDGEEQDAYILGVNEPVKKFEGVIIAAIHREDDVEDKWVVASNGVLYDQAQIMEAVYFQEQYFKTTIDHIYHKSVGVILFRKNEDKIEYILLFQPESQTWSFPKGHMEAFENELQTATREVKEETGLSFIAFPNFREEISYSREPKYCKTVVLFLAQVNGEIKIKDGEIEEFRWVDKNKACELLFHKHYIEILNNAERTISILENGLV